MRRTSHERGELGQVASRVSFFSQRLLRTLGRKWRRFSFLRRNTPAFPGFWREQRLHRVEAECRAGEQSDAHLSWPSVLSGLILNLALPCMVSWTCARRNFRLLMFSGIAPSFGAGSPEPDLLFVVLLILRNAHSRHSMQGDKNTADGKGAVHCGSDPFRRRLGSHMLCSNLADDGVSRSQWEFPLDDDGATPVFRVFGNFSTGGKTIAAVLTIGCFFPQNAAARWTEIPVILAAPVPAMFAIWWLSPTVVRTGRLYGGLRLWLPRTFYPQAAAANRHWS